MRLALIARSGEMGYPSVLSAKTWGFYDVLFKGQPFKFQRPYGSYVMENVLFKISYPAEFHAQTAVECAMQLHERLRLLGRKAEDISRIVIRTHEACLRIIDKQGPLNNPADRDHCIQYMVAVPLLYGRLTAADYEDGVARDPRIDALRAKIVCVEDPAYTRDYHDPAKRSIANALTVEFEDGARLDEVVCEYPIGHLRRRSEGIPLLEAVPHQPRPRVPGPAAAPHPRCLAGSGAAGGDAGERIRRPLCDLGGMGIPEAPVALPPMRLTWRSARARQTAQARESRGLQCGFPRKRDRAMAMLWVKTFHIVFIASWFAGLFYLPRIFVNLAQQSDASVQATLLGMARRLYRFTTLLAVVAVAFGMWLYLGYRIGVGPGNGWMHAKLFSCCS